MTKIAVVTEDGVTISQHFGMAPYYLVLTVENGKIVSREKRNKAGHQTAGGSNCHSETGCHNGMHGIDADAQKKHAGMFANILDSQFVLAGGMGYGAFASLKNSGIEPVITDAKNIEEAAQLFITGKLENLTHKLH
jgi:predicted Fe-Mo cluster-binding NifX family protein